ncbi:helix-turn-helix transcriptional regulator [bacterium]|nr:helix-turn-helix transcriptional regulator [bacterium]
MTDTKKYLGTRIQEIRKQKGLKQSELAEIVDIDPKHMSKIECGRCFPSFELLDKIAEVLQKPVSDFLNTEHLQSRKQLTEQLVKKLEEASDEKFKTVYKILNEIL